MLVSAQKPQSNLKLKSHAIRPLYSQIHSNNPHHQCLSHSGHSSGAPKRIKPLIRVPNERQTHLRAHIIALGLRLRTQLRRHIRLGYLIDREVLRVNVGSELGLEGGADPAQGVPDHAAEERVLFDFVAAAQAAEAVVRVAD